MLSPKDIEAIKNAFEGITKDAFYYNIDFYISILIGLLGLWFSIRSFKEARKAKEAANNASRSVKRQSFIIEILELSRKCNIQNDIDYAEVSKRYTDISSKISFISAYYNDDNSNTDVKLIIREIQGTLEKIRSILNDSNPIMLPQQANIPNQMYFSIEPHFSIIAGHLGSLNGLLESSISHH